LIWRVLFHFISFHSLIFCSFWRFLPGEDALVLSRGSGGVICVDGSRSPGQVVMDFNSEGMFRGCAALRRLPGGDLVTTGQVGIWQEMSEVGVKSQQGCAVRL
jgi:hypothetical protein